MVKQLLEKLDELIRIFKRSELPEVMDKTEKAQLSLVVALWNINYSIITRRTRKEY